MVIQMNKHTFAALMLLVPAFLGLASAQELPQPQKLLDTATKLSDLSGLYPYQFNAHVVLNRGTTVEKSGTLTIYRDKTNYRYELQIADYREVVMREGDRLYTYYSAFPAPGLGSLRSIDKWPKELASKNIAGRTVKKKVEHVEDYCVDFKAGPGWRLRGCFDPAQFSLLEVSSEEQTTSFLKYQHIGEQLFPGAIRIVRTDPGQTVELNDIHIQKLPPGPATFEIPRGGREFQTCDDEQPAERVTPAFSNPALVPVYRANPIVAYFYAVIDEQGKMHDLAVYSPSHHEDEWKKLTELWRFKPAMCGGKPIASEWQNSVVVTVRPNQR